MAFLFLGLVFGPSASLVISDVVNSVHSGLDGIVGIPATARFQHDDNATDRCATRTDGQERLN